MIELSYTGQIKGARKLLIDNKFATVEEVAMMGNEEVEYLLNKKFDGYCPSDDGEIIYLVPKVEKISYLYVSR